MQIDDVGDEDVGGSVLLAHGGLHGAGVKLGGLGVADEEGGFFERGDVHAAAAADGYEGWIRRGAHGRSVGCSAVRVKRLP